MDSEAALEKLFIDIIWWIQSLGGDRYSYFSSCQSQNGQKESYFSEIVLLPPSIYFY